MKTFSLACPVRLDAQGERIAGCGRGWTGERTEACPGCGLPGQVRQVIEVIPLTLGDPQR